MASRSTRASKSARSGTIKIKSNRPRKRANEAAAAPYALAPDEVQIQHRMADVPLFPPPPQAHVVPEMGQPFEANRGRGGAGLDADAELEPAEPERQGGFMFAGKRFKMSKPDLAKKLRQHKKTKKRFAQNEELSNAAAGRILENSQNPNPQKNHTSYKKMLEAAMLAEIKSRAAARARAEPPPAKVERRSPVDAAEALGLSPEVKIARLKDLQRSASIVALTQTEPMRLAKYDVKRYQHRDDLQQDYTVGGPGHFLLGGSADHSYKKMIEEIKLSREINDQEAAAYLMHALDGGEIAGPEHSLARKFISIVHTSEFARSAINPVAMRAGLAGVVKQEGDVDAFDSLRYNVLHVAAEQERTKDAEAKDGGSRRSQHHREAVDEQDPEFRKIAIGQHDSIARMAAEHGYPPESMEHLSDFVKKSTGAVMQQRIGLFGRAAGEPVIDEPAGGKAKARKKGGASAAPLAPVRRERAKKKTSLKPKAAPGPAKQKEESSDDGGQADMEFE